MRLALIAILLASCGPAKKRAQANQCATAPATYSVRYEESATGTCGGITDTAMNIDSDGSIPGDAPTCERSSNEGCVSVTTKCKATKPGKGDCTITTGVTFTFDGADAVGSATLVCDECKSVYDVTLTRL